MERILKEQKEKFALVPRVVCLRRRGGQIVQDCDVYIGRKCEMGGWKLPQSKWHNPFTIKQCGSAQEAIRRYKIMKYISNHSPNS